MTFISNDFIYISKHAYAINSDFLSCKNDKFQLTIFEIFVLIFAQNIGRGNALQLPH